MYFGVKTPIIVNWNTLFSPQRLNETLKNFPDSVRSAYEVDFDRVVFSSAFRRLQDKTQVIPLPESDFVHNRLTHSLEVSSVGRTLGKIVGKKIIDKYSLQDISVHDFGAIVGSACLAHDIGNPPFGHSGESAISSYFVHGKGKKYEELINDKEKWNDLIFFEGNANGFRLLTSAGNIKLTYTTLATFTKYPCKSFKKQGAEIPIIYEKYGYFISERKEFETIFKELKISQISDGVWQRHPLAYLVEAADDICYRIIDFEDGVRIGLVSFEKAEELLKLILPNNEFNESKYLGIKSDQEKLGYLRSKVINTLINQVAQIFLENEETILNGKYDKHLLDDLTCGEHLREIKTISVKKIYNSNPVVLIEVAGFNVVGELLDYFINAVNDFYEYKEELRVKNLLSAKLIKVLPVQFLAEDKKPNDDLYIRILQICEFIAGMTDTYAMKLYKRLKGIELPH